jgi:hypothetical protein
VTVSPDEGMMLLQQRMAGDRAIAAADPAAPDDTGGGSLAIMVRLAAAIEANTATHRYIASREQIAWENSHLIEIPPGQLATAGTLDDPDRYGPRAGFAWRVLGISFILLAGTTSFTVWMDSPNDPTNEVFASTVSGRWEPSHFFLLPGRRLVYTSVGGGLTVSKGNAFEFSLDAVPRAII